MTGNSKKSNKNPYRVVQIEGKISFKVQELWDGGVERGPYGSKNAAIASEGNFARDNGFINELDLQEVIEEKVSPTDAFQKDSNGNWTCTKACAIEIENKKIVFAEGMSFIKGALFAGVDVIKWLEEND